MSLPHWTRTGLAALLFTACLLVPSNQATAQDSSQSMHAMTPVIETSIEDWVTEHGFSGSVLIARENAQIFSDEYGLADREAGIPVDPDTRFLAASLTKTFTTVLVLQAVEAGQVSLDDTLDTLVPEFAAPYAHQLTVRLLLQNRSGLPHYVDLPDWFSPEGKDRYTQQVLLDTVADMPLRFEPGSEYYYSNVNFYLLGLILDRVGEAPYETQLQTKIFDRFGLVSSGQIYDIPTGVALAGNYLTEDDGSVSRIEMSNPAVFRATGSLYSSSSDLLLWGQAMLGEELLGPESRAVMFDQERPMAWMIAEVPAGDGTVEVGTYNGRIAGHVSMLTVIPQTQDVIVLLSNNGVGYGQLAGLTVELAGLLANTSD